MIKMIKTILSMMVSFVMVFSIHATETTFLGFEETAESWTIGAADPLNIVTLEDDFEDYVEGDGAMKVTVALTNQVAWGTWTDISYMFDTPADLSGYTEMRFKMKLLKEPTGNCRTMQFTCDLFESADADGNSEFWRYPEDLDIFYSPSALGDDSEWFEVVIPFSRLAIPGWATTTNGSVDLGSIEKFAFGVHSDSSSAIGCNPNDTVSFLIDDLHLTNPVHDVQGLSFDEGVDAWVIGMADPLNTVTLEDDFEHYMEGDGSMKVTVTMGHDSDPAENTGWTDINIDLTDADGNGVDIGDATEFRFSLKVDTDNLIVKKNMGMTMDLTDENQLFRWGGDNERPGHWGGFNHIDIAFNEWKEYVVPFADMFTPGWADSPDFDDVIESPTKFAFGIHHSFDTILDEDGVTVLNAAVTDTVVFWLDNMRFTHSTTDASLNTKDDQRVIANTFTLANAYPNPFNPSTKIDFILENQNEINMAIFNVNGQLIQTLKSGIQPAGAHSVVWNGRNTLGELVGSGVYIYSLSTPEKSVSKRLIFLK